MSSYNRCDTLIPKQELPLSEGSPGHLPLCYHTLIQQGTPAGPARPSGFPPANGQLVPNEVSMFVKSTSSNNYNERQIRLINYLESRVKAGKNFFKSKYIAKETGLSSKEVGTNMGILAGTCPEFSIERYSYSNSTTWMVTPSQI